MQTREKTRCGCEGGPVGRNEWTKFGKVGCNDIEKGLWGQMKESALVNLQAGSIAPVEAFKQQWPDKIHFTNI